MKRLAAVLIVWIVVSAAVGVAVGKAIAFTNPTDDQEQG